MAPKIICNFGVVNRKLHIILLMLGMTILMPSICFARDRSVDSLVLFKVWNYAQNHQQTSKGVERNVYLSYTYKTERRNPTLFLVPTMYSIAKGAREFFGEAYYKMKFHDAFHYDFHRQVICSTIPHNRTVMPNMLQYLTPNLYNETLYDDKMLSPFYYSNRFFYKYLVIPVTDKLAIIRFRPRTNNTQLIRGRAFVNIETGRINSIGFEGEFDMIKFNVTAAMNMSNEEDIVLPDRCLTESTFNFLGNKIVASCRANYNCPTTLPDSIDNVEDIKLMETLRPTSLTTNEQEIYDRHLEAREMKNQPEDTIPEKKSARFTDFLWENIGYNLINSTHANSGPASMRISPLFNPLYFSYSQSRGFSYKLNIGLQYTFNTHRYLTLNPQMGYNFKQRQFYYTAPLRMTYNPKRNGYAEFTWANGNRTNHASLVDDIIEKEGENFEVPEFKDEIFQLVNNVEAFDWVEVMTGLVYHRRRSTNRELMKSIGFPDEFRSFAPLLTFHFKPWQQKGPTLTANYERAIKGIFKSDLDYERWEFDLSYKHDMKSMRQINLRAGTGLYTQRSSDYFVDYTNFCDNNLATGWDDDWTGQFQLLDSRWYNESNYYIRGHLSFESPILALTWVPLVGHFVEMERLYFSALNIERRKPYFELGYGFTTRYLSTGFFTSFVGAKFESFGCKFTIELFRRW